MHMRQSTSRVFHPVSLVSFPSPLTGTTDAQPRDELADAIGFLLQTLFGTLEHRWNARRESARPEIDRRLLNVVDLFQLLFTQARTDQKVTGSLLATPPIFIEGTCFQSRYGTNPCKK